VQPANDISSSQESLTDSQLMNAVSKYETCLSIMSNIITYSFHMLNTVHLTFVDTIETNIAEQSPQSPTDSQLVSAVGKYFKVYSQCIMCYLQIVTNVRVMGCSSSRCLYCRRDRGGNSRAVG